MVTQLHRLYSMKVLVLVVVMIAISEQDLDSGHAVLGELGSTRPSYSKLCSKMWRVGASAGCPGPVPGYWEGISQR